MSSQLPAKIQLGDFVFDTLQRQLLREDSVTVLEPKVYDVLCFLVLHPQRFVSLAELHQYVWAGRIVTDTAVRRTISKLRLALSDTEIDPPRYLKTQTKLGYMLVCEVNITADQLPAQWVSEEPTIVKPARSLKLIVALSLFVTLSVMAYLLVRQHAASIVVSPIASFPGTKLALSVSPDGRYLSYISQSLHDKQWRPFLYDTSNGMLNPLEFTTDYLNSSFSVPSFDADGSLIAAHYSPKDKRVSLAFYNLADIRAPVQQISADQFQKLTFVYPIKSGRYLVNAQQHNSLSEHFYIFDRSREQFNQLTFSNLDRVVDIDARVSPNGDYAAVLRQVVSPQFKLSLQLYRLSDSTYLTEWPLPGTQHDGAESGFSWLNNEQLLLSKTDELYRIDINQTRLEKLSDKAQVRYIQRDSHGQLYAVQQGEIHTELTKSYWGRAGHILQRFALPYAVYRQDFAETDDKHWLLVKQGNVFSLHRYTPQTGERELVIADTEGYRLEAQSSQLNLLIFRKGFHMRLFDLSSHTWGELSHPTQRVSYATFSPDNRFIWFNERIGSEWFINQLDLRNRETQRLVEGYFQLYQWRQYYIGITANGDIWLLDQKMSRLRQIPITFITHHRHDIALRGDSFLIAHLPENGLWQFERYDFITGETERIQDETVPVEASFSIDNSGTKMLISAQAASNSDLVKLNIQ